MLYITLLIVVAIVGFCIIPLASIVFRDGFPTSVGELLALGHIMLVQVSWGGSALVMLSNGAYDLLPLRVDGDDIRVLLRGEWHPVDGTTADLDRWAFGWFTMLVERGDQLNAITAPTDIVDVQTDGGQRKGMLDEWRGGNDLEMNTYRAFNPALDPECDVVTGEGPLIDLAAVATRLKGANQELLAAAGKQKALLEHGRLTQQGPIATAIVFVVCLVLGALTAYVGMGGV